MVKIKKEQINNKQNIWIEIGAVLFVVIILSVNFSDFQKFDLSAVLGNVSWGTVNIDQNLSTYIANVSAGFDVVKEDINKINLDVSNISTKGFYFLGYEITDRMQDIGNVYNKGIATIREGSVNYASVFYSNLTNNLGVIDRQLHSAKTNFCK